MNSGPTSERVHEAIRCRLFNRDFQPGERLDPAMLAQELSSSITPVRDALHLLAGQFLVVTGTSEGFRVPHLDEPALKDLYGWTADVLILALRSGRVASRGVETEGIGAEHDTVESLFLGIARTSGNAEHERAIRSLNDRLRAVRAAEQSVLGSSAAELGALAAAYRHRDRRELRRLVASFHRLRSRHAADIVRAHYRRQVSSTP